MIRWLLAALIAAWIPNLALAQQSLVGTYKLVSFQSHFDDGATADLLGSRPNGYAVITPTRFIVVLASENRKPGLGTEDKVALYNSFISYSGPYRVEGQKLLTTVDVSWNQAWTGTTQGRTWKVDGNHLTLTTDKAPFYRDPTKMSYGTLVWEKIE